ncbi:hypothetical protein LTR60_005296, partial [Cryomyces antarcticus]
MEASLENMQEKRDLVGKRTSVPSRLPVIARVLSASSTDTSTASTSFDRWWQLDTLPPRTHPQG